MPSQVRVRFAPSPTGYFHIGSARTALFNWLYARHTGGVFILRIEDTDQARNQDAFLQVIYDSMRWLGLDWDEGPGVGGKFGPYRQSERGDIYREYLDRLKATGRTYEKEGATYFRISDEPQVIDDAIRGRVERKEEKDFVIVRSDGSPVFHVVNVIDDLTMGVTHVIRGEDHLSNTSKHVELFKALGAPLPIYAHVPLILKQNGPGKMSKRDQGALVEEYQRRGFFAEALVNFLALLGWSPKDDSEKMPLAELARRFDLPGINQSNARFDDKKLAHMNMLYLLAATPEDFVNRVGAYLLTQNTPEAKRALAAPPDYFREVVALAQPKLKGIEEVPAYTAYFFTDDFAIDEKARAKVIAKGDPAARVRELAEGLAQADFATDASLEQAVQAIAAAHGLTLSDYVHPGRLAVSGTNVGPSFYSLLRVLGRDRVLARLGKFKA
ncbi:MAG TPA: glutamate--tRNA ligase family protein [Opitutaceae bacterium]|jgi:glutamyl-tRNA synthetase|nr:glutamate--tRNA ligase family protein [Opitutaceae bacterium]